MSKPSPVPRFKLQFNKTDPSTAIILSFHAKWHDPMARGDFSVVFRKTGPTGFRPDVMYAYFSAPIKAIGARMRVTGYEYMSVGDALLLAKAGAIGEEELRVYAKDYPQLLVYQIDNIEMASRPITLQQLASDYDYCPSSTFMPLSSYGTATLDRLGFTQRRASQ